MSHTGAAAPNPNGTDVLKTGKLGERRVKNYIILPYKKLTGEAGERP